jgi:hypothetical protein
MTTESRPAPVVGELRQTTRIAVSWRARILINDQSFIDCRTFDISLGGIGVVCREPLTKGAVYRVALQMPLPGVTSGRVVTSQAAVVFQILSGRDYRVGMQWTEPWDPALSPLDEWSLKRP